MFLVAFTGYTDRFDEPELRDKLKELSYEFDIDLLWYDYPWKGQYTILPSSMPDSTVRQVHDCMTRTIFPNGHEYNHGTLGFAINHRDEVRAIYQALDKMEFCNMCDYDEKTYKVNVAGIPVEMIVLDVDSEAG